jgi:hypothetical protein
MKTKHIIIGLIILVGLLFLIQKNEHAGSTPPAQNLSNEAIQNIAKIYADTNNEAIFNNIKATGTAIVNGATILNGDTTIKGNATFKSGGTNTTLGTHFPYTDGKNYIRGPTNIDGDTFFNGKTDFSGKTDFNGDTTFNKSVTIVGNLCLQSADGKKVCLTPDSGVFGSLGITKKNGQNFTITTDGNNQGLGKGHTDGSIAWVKF